MSDLKPTLKHPDIEKLLEMVCGNQRGDICTICSTPKVFSSNFRNDRSRREFQISGMCQTCQDNFFGKD